MKSTLLALFATTVLGLAQTYQESGGLVIMEMENTSSSLGQWQLQSSISGYTGSGYLNFNGNNFQSGPVNSPLEYAFKINQGGLYYLHLHCAKVTQVINGETRNDVSNDCYVRVEGNYDSGPGPHDGHGDNASLSLLKSDTKYFGGSANAWKWENGQNSSGANGNLDPGGESNKRVAVYSFRAGETYKLVISGRSKAFKINRIMFRRDSVAKNSAQNLSNPESATTGGGSSIVYDAIDDFTNITGGDVPYYVDNGNDVLAIAANDPLNRVGFARASRTFGGPTGTYDVTITTMTELDGESTYRLLVNGAEVRSHTNPFVLDPPNSPLDLQPHTHTWSGVALSNGDTIAIESNADSNDLVSEAGDGSPPWAWARGRWRQIEFSANTSLIQPPLGRIAVVADGNSPDPDDIGATAVMFGLLKGAGLEDRLVHLSHSCDLNPFMNGGSQSIDAANELRRQNKLQALCGEGVGFFGPFPNLTDYYNCRTEQTAAVDDLRDAINASSATDPLWIIEAGEPDVIGYALQAATPSKRQFVHVVSHHPANDNSGDFFTWQQILDFGVTEHQIGDQNVGLQVLISTGLWDWAEDHPQPGIAWIWDQLKYAERDGVVAFQTNKFDCSDAGMLYWWITGASSGGNNTSTPVEIRNMLLFDPTGPVAHWSLDEGSGSVVGDVSGNGYTGTLLNGATWGSDGTRASYVSFDGTNDRIETLFSYALTASDDFTWAWWANQAASNASSAIMIGNRYPEGSPGERYEFIKLMANEAQFANSETAGGIEKYNYADLPTNQWHHYAMVKTGNSYQWFVDGVAQGAPSVFTYDESSAIPVLIGGDDDGSGKPNEHFEGSIDDVILYNRALSSTEVANVRDGIYGPDPNLPQVNAGSGKVITSPVDSVSLVGTATDTSEIVSTVWTQEFGPNVATLSGDTTLSLTASGLEEGTYVFRLTATDDEDNTAFDDVTVTVNAAPTGPAVTALMLINADTNEDIGPINDGDTLYLALLPTTNLNVRADTTSEGVGSVRFAYDGNANYKTESIAPYALEGDTAGDYNPWTPSLGSHILTATPYSGGSASGTAGTALTVNFTVEADDPGLPVVDAGPSQVVTLPTDSITLTGTATDNGSVVSTIWTQESGPNTATLASDTTLSMTASDLVQGAYVFRLTATDNETNTAFDEAIVNVVPEGGGVAVISGELKKWHKVTLSWTGPSTNETASINPFSDYRLDVTFSHAVSGKSYTVPGYFAADGNAAETSAQSGNVWRAHFAPDEAGDWAYSVSFRSGADIAVREDGGAPGGFFDTDSGTFQVVATDKTGRDLRGKGRLQYVGRHHLQFEETGEYFMKVGPDAPENFLAYDDFDDTPNDQKNQPNLRKSWSPHAGDYDAASAAPFTWQGGKGTEILGAVRYLSEKGMNVFSFLTFNVDGDDDNVFPHRLRSSVAAYEALSDNARWASTSGGVHHDRFDVSKMDQWERVFEYGTQMGMYLHFKTQETENDDRMDGGALGRERKLYYRELVARYGHHLALNWNLGEENTNNTAQQQDFAQWFYDNDPYRNNVVLHTYPNAKNTVYTPLLGAASKLTGLSLQTNQADFSNVFPDTLTWVQNSASAGMPWVVACDEPGDAQHALRPAGDAGNSWTDGRKNALWGNVMAGGAGVEFYFGYQHANSDLTCQDLRSRDGFWDYCRYMLDFFSDNQVPFQDMSNENALVSNANAWCLRKPGEAYVVYLKDGGTTNLNLSAAPGDFEVRWFDPRNGGPLQQGSVTSVTGGANVSLGTAPSTNASDWVVYVANGTGSGETTSGVMEGLSSDADVRADGVITSLTSDNLVPGKSGGSGGINRSSHFVFRLPDLGPIEDPFVAATLGFYVSDVSASPPGVDLYGLGKRMTADVVAEDYYGESAASDTTDATLIQRDILTGSTGAGFKNSTAISALSAFLNAQYDGGDGIGKFVFLRLSSNEAITGLQRHFVTSADAAGSNGPRISYTALLPQDFDTWMESYTFSPGADLTPEGDPDGDGHSTWFEYLFGLDPSNGSSVNPITSYPEPAGGTFRYTRRNPALTGFTDYRTWISRDLSDWMHDPAASQQVVVDGDVQEVEVTLSGPKPHTDSSLFIRVRVE